MLGNTLCKAIENLMKKYQLTPYQQKKIREYFSYIKVDDLIYASTLKSKIVVKIDIAYRILEDLKEQGYLINIYEIYCYDCDNRKKYIKALNQYKENMYCEYCGKKLTMDENIIVLYKVVTLCAG